MASELRRTQTQQVLDATQREIDELLRTMVDSERKIQRLEIIKDNLTEQLAEA